jgi:hypothetical protein
MKTLLTLAALLCFSSYGHTAEDAWSLGPYKVETSYESSGGRRYTITRNGEALFSKFAGQFWFVSVAGRQPSSSLHEPVLKDINGDGVRDLIVEQYPVGGHCCWSYSVFSMGSKFKPVAEIGGFPSPMSFQDVNGDSVYEIVGEDSTFYSWYASPRIILRYDSGLGTYRLAASLMKRAAPTAEQMAAKAREFSKATRYAGYPVAPEVYRYMLDLIYSGNAQSAWRFLELAWQATPQERQSFIATLRGQLNRSPYAAEIEAMN